MGDDGLGLGLGRGTHAAGCSCALARAPARTVLAVAVAPGSHAPTPGRFGADSAYRVLRNACNAAGLCADDAELMRLGENALFRISDRGGVVARIARTMDYWSDVKNEVNVSRWLQSIEFPAATVIDIDQPIAVDGHPVTFWAFIPGRPGSNEDIATLGMVLRRLHALARPNDFSLPEEDILGRVRSRIESANISHEDASFLASRLTELDSAVKSLQYPLGPGPTHGDAHSENLMIQDGVPVLIDFERFAWGQPEWDLAMTATEYESAGWWSPAEYDSFVSAYGYDVRTWRDGYPVLRSVHEIKMTTWLMQNVDESPEIANEYRARMLTMRGDAAAPRMWRPF